MIRRFPSKCSVCGSTKHNKSKCPKLAPKPKASEQLALAETVASQARSIEGLLEVVKVLGKPVVFETKGNIAMSEPRIPPDFFKGVLDARRQAYDECIRIVKEHDGSTEDGQYLMSKLLNARDEERTAELPSGGRSDG